MPKSGLIIDAILKNHLNIMKYLYAFCMAILFSSCIPYAIKPNIADYKITNGKKFKKGLPNQTVFIFEDPKDADEFYTYINVKFNKTHRDVEYNSPFKIDNQVFYLTFYEAERTTKTINLLPIVTDAVLESKNITDGETFVNNYASRDGKWYLIISVNDESYEDALSESSLHKNKILSFLREMKHEYLATANYQEIYFKNPPLQN